MDQQDGTDRGAERQFQLPVAGYPISEDAVTHWFQQTYRRPPSDMELGAIIDAMAEREASPPYVGPHAEAEGRKLGPSTLPAGRR